MEIVVHRKKSLIQQKFQKKFYYFIKNSQFRSVMWKMIQWDTRSRSWQKNPTPTPCVVRNLTPIPPKNLRLLMTPNPQPCFQGHKEPTKTKLQAHPKMDNTKREAGWLEDRVFNYKTWIFGAPVSSEIYDLVLFLSYLHFRIKKNSLAITFLMCAM